jgi:filamentous hemagglutinin
MEGYELDSKYQEEAALQSGGTLLVGVVLGGLPSKQGGAHRDTTKPVGDGLDSHHCPAKSCYDGVVSPWDGPAIKMDPEDHKKTASAGSSDEAIEYRRIQEELLQQGRLMDAVMMDVRDIRSKFGDKYEDGIGQMLEYAESLDPNDFIRR